MDQKAIKPLLPALEIVETGFNLKRKCLLKRLEPTQQFTELLTVQSPGVLGSEGIAKACELHDPDSDAPSGAAA